MFVKFSWNSEWLRKKLGFYSNKICTHINYNMFLNMEKKVIRKCVVIELVTIFFDYK